MQGIFGTIPQWVSAVAAIGAVAITAWGLYSAQPIFQNERLKEDNAKLEADLRTMHAALSGLRSTNWDFVCRQLATRVATVNMSLNFMGSAYEKFKGQDFNLFWAGTFLKAKTGRRLLELESQNEDYGTLLGGDVAALGLFIAGVIVADQEAMDEPFSLLAEEAEITPETVTRHLALMARFAKATARLEPRCVDANPARTPPPA